MPRIKITDRKVPGKKGTTKKKSGKEPEDMDDIIDAYADEQSGDTGNTKKTKKTGTTVDECPDGTCGLNNGSFDDDGLGDDLLASVLGEEVEEKVQMKVTPLKELAPEKIYIRDRCIQFGKMVGPETRKQGKKRLEVGGFFLRDIDEDKVTLMDFIVPKDLPVTTGSIYVAEHYDQAAREVRAENQVLKIRRRIGAMFHIHPSEKGQGLYHSQDDNEVLVNLVNKMSKTTKVPYDAPFALFQEKIRTEYGDDGIYLRGDALSDYIQRFVYPEDELFFKALQEFGLKPDAKDFKKAEFLARLLDMVGKETYEPRIVAYGISFVFNNGGDNPFVKLGIRERFAFSGTEDYDSIANIPYEITDVGIDIPTAEEVAAIVKQRVKFPYVAPKNVAKAAAGRFFDNVAGVWRDVGSKGKGKKGSKGGKGKAYQGGARGPQGFHGQGTSTATSSYARGRKTARHILKEGIEDLVLPEPEVEDNIGSELLEAIDTGEAIGMGNGKKDMPKDQIEKSDGKYYSISEITDLFGLALFSYLREGRHPQSKYSTYVSVLVSLLSAYHGPHKSANLRTSISHAGKQNYIDMGPILGLRSCIEELGPLVEDNPLVVKRHKIDFFKLNNMTDNIYGEIAHRPKGVEYDDETVQFMSQFIVGTTFGRNVLLKSYVESVLESYDQGPENYVPIGTAEKPAQEYTGIVDTHGQPMSTTYIGPGATVTPITPQTTTNTTTGKGSANKSPAKKGTDKK